MNEIKKKADLFLPYKGGLFLVSLLNLLSNIFSILSFLLIEPFTKLLFGSSDSNLSFLNQYILHFFYPKTAEPNLTEIAILIVILFLFKNIFLIASSFCMAPINSKIIRDLRNAVYYKILILPLSYFSNSKRGEIVSRAVNDTQEVEFTLIKAIQQFLTDPFTVLIYLLVLFYLSPALTLFVLLLLPVAGFIISTVSRVLRKKSLLAKEKLGNIFTHVEETIAGLRIIKGFNAQKHSNNIFNNLNASFAKLQKKIYRRSDLASPLSEVLGVTVVMIILVFGGMQVLRGNSTLSPELFIVYIFIITQIINPAKNIATAYTNYQRGDAALKRALDILNADEVILEKENAIPVSTFTTDIRFEDVSFSYGQTEALKNINLTVKKGEVCAIAGNSGSGKSTLVDLLPRFYDPASGQITIDNIPVHEMVIDDLRSLFAIVTQDVVLFNDTIFNNITYGLENVSCEAVIHAAKQAHAYDFIMALPEQFNTQIGDRGLTLSGGERQRISIARALLRNAPILILDEATSALDIESEKLVQDAIDNMLQEKTVFVIAHKFSTIQNADKIIVLEDGRIVECGSHSELIEQQGSYAALAFARQNTDNSIWEKIN